MGIPAASKLARFCSAAAIGAFLTISGVAFSQQLVWEPSVGNASCEIVCRNRGLFQAYSGYYGGHPWGICRYTGGPRDAKDRPGYNIERTAANALLCRLWWS
jgi:hypothetical protein